MPRPPCPFNRSITRLLLCAALVGALSNKAFAQPTCQLDEAARAYAAGALEQARQLIDSCLSSRATEEQRIQAYALLAKLSLAVDDVDAAQQAVAALLGVMPDFAPALDDPPRFVQLIAQLRRELSRTTTSSVSKMNESLREAPATVIVVTAEQIRRRGYLDLEQVLHDLPGFDISRSNGYSYSNIYQRGFRSDTTSRTLFLVDGVEQNDLHSNTAHISRQFPLTNIDRVEVVYGPASTMYGANAFLGVINVITKDPDDVIAEGKQIGADVQVGGGAWSTKFIDATVAGRYRGATLSLTGRVYKSDEWDLSKYENWNYNPVDFVSNRSLTQYRPHPLRLGYRTAPSEIPRRLRRPCCARSVGVERQLKRQTNRVFRAHRRLVDIRSIEAEEFHGRTASLAAAGRRHERGDRHGGPGRAQRKHLDSS